MGRLFLFSAVAMLTINLFVLPRELIEERGRAKKDAKRWDKVLTSINIIPTILLYVCSGLDYRFEWTGDMNNIIHITGLILIFSGSMIFTWSMISNKFFSTLVRLQFDRQHTVITGGPYKIVRHPGYVGYIIMSVSTPIALGTLWALVFSGITYLLFIYRTALEDKTLLKELGGYIEYAEKVKYRLIPLIW
ncbi:MAG: isoprenylcysteine carboxylmethyltransferase family protein [Bacteroidales bacterium]|nr:isoprenylcysteine carboxylmethyltransferase family protein [Bacteroidales bacterium]